MIEVKSDTQAKVKKLLDTLVSRLPHKLDSLFGMRRLPDEQRGACATYSRMLVEVLAEFGIKAAVRPVYIETANRAGLNYLRGGVTKGEAVRLGGRLQVWGDINRGQPYQHAICYIPEWDAVVDLSMGRRASGLVSSYPYWSTSNELPWWVVTFRFMSYSLEYRGYETHPSEVEKAKEVIRRLIRSLGWQQKHSAES